MSQKTNLAYTINEKHYKTGVLIKMLEKGISNFRINLGRTDSDISKKICDFLKNKAADMECDITIELDLPGAKGRILLNQELYVDKNQIITMSAKHDGNSTIATDAEWLVELLCENDCVRLGRKGAKGIVQSIEDGVIFFQIVQSGKLSNKDLILVENRPIPLPYLTKKDEIIMEQICDYDFNYLAVSFSQSEEQIESIRLKFCELRGKNDVKFIAKIEEPMGMTNYQEILTAADGIMIGRGDMSEYVGMVRTNMFIDSVLRDWKPGKELMLASYYFLDFLNERGVVDPCLYTQDRPFLTYFITDESSYHDWEKINEIYTKGLCDE